MMATGAQSPSPGVALDPCVVLPMAAKIEPCGGRAPGIGERVPVRTTSVYGLCVCRCDY